MTAGRLRLATLIATSLLAATACTSSSRGASEPETSPNPPPDGLTYVAIGASETLGLGATNPFRDSWPRVLLGAALPEGSELLNLGLLGSTVESALERALPRAERQRPDVVTVWLNVNDIFAGVAPHEFERALDELLARLVAAGPDQVLVANTPPLAGLPAYRACRPRTHGGLCLLGTGLPAPGRLRDLVNRYNRAIGRVVARHDATLVDLHAALLDARRSEQADELISGDGLHPSTAGHRAIAGEFAAELVLP